MSDYATSRSNYLKIMFGNLNKEISGLTGSKTMNSVGDTSFDAAEMFAYETEHNNAIKNAQDYLNTHEQQVVKDNRSGPWAGYKRFWDTIEETVNNVSEGLLNFGDDIFDLLVNVSGEIGSAFGADKSWTKKITGYDWQAQVLRANDVFSFTSLMSGDIFTKENWTDGWDAEGARARINQTHANSLWNYAGEDVHNFVNGVENSIGYMIPSILVGMATGGTSVGAQTAFTVGGEAVTYSSLASLGTMAVGAFAGGTNEAYEETGDLGKSSLYGLANAAVEVGTELVVGPILGKIGAGTNKVAGMIGKSTSKATESFVKEMAKTMFEEGVEEAVSAVLEPVAKSIYKGSDAFKSDNGEFIYFDKDFWLSGNESVLGQGLSGAVSGGILGGVSISQQYSALGKDGVTISNLLEENKDLASELSKYDKTSEKYTQICEKISLNVAEISGLMQKIKNSGNQKHFKNVAQLLSDPVSFFNALNSEDSQALNNLVTDRISEMKNIERFGTRNLFNELQEKFGTDYQLEFSNLPKNTNAKINNETKTIVINSQLTDTLAPALVHEYIGHAIGNKMSTDVRNSIFDKVTNTDWFKKNNSKLRKSYQGTQEYKKLSSIHKESYWKSEVINNYVQSLFKSNTNAKSIKMINDVFLRNVLLKRFSLNFKENETRAMLKNNAILKEFSQSIDTLLQMTDKNVHRAFNKFIRNEELTKSEQNIYNKYKEIFDSFKQSFSQLEQYSKNVDETEDLSYNERKKGERSDEFRRIQEESRRELTKSSRERIYAKNNEGLRERLSTIFKRELDSRGYNSSSNRLLHLESKNNIKFDIYENVDGDLFHDIFEVTKTYTENGELVDLHDNYNDATCYISDDGLSGFAITKSSDLISVFNCGTKRGFLYAISPVVKSQAKTLDCYVSPHQNLEAMYSKIFNFKTASIMEYNMEYDHDDIAENHGKPQVAFMVNTDKIVETKNFNKDQYDEAQSYQQSFIKNNNFEKINNTNQYENLKPYETNKAKEIKDGAQEKEGKIISLKSVNDIYNAIEKSISDMMGDEFKIDSKNAKARRLFEEFNIAKNDSKKSNCKKFVQDILNQDVISHAYIGEGSITYEEYLKSKGLDPKTILNEGTELLYELLNAKAVESKTSNKIKKLQKWIDRYIEAKNDFKAVVQFIKTLNGIKKVVGNKVAKYGNTGQIDLKSGMKGLFNSYFSKFRFTKGQYLSLTNIKNLQNMVQYGSFNALIDSIINPNNEVNNLPTLVAMTDTIKEMALDLSNSLTTGQKHLTYEQVIQFNNLNKAMYKLYNEYNSGVLEATREQAETLIKRAKEVSNYHSSSVLKNKVTSALFDALSPKDIIAFMCGGTYTDAFNTIYNELYKKPYEAQIGKYVDFLTMRDQNIKALKKEQFKPIRIEGIKMQKYVLYQFYLNTLSPDNLERMKNSNLSYTMDGGTTKRVSFESLNKAVNEMLNESEKADLDAIFALYNNEVKEYVENMSQKILGFKVSRENYYPIVGSDAFKIKDFSNPVQMRFNVNALNNGRLKKLSNRRTVIEINVNPLNLFSSYIESMTITGEIGLPSQKLNRLFQLKNSNGESFSTIVSSYVPNATSVYIPSIFNKLIGNVEVTERSAFLDKLVGRFSTATLGFNFRSMLKQIGSFFTAWEKVGITTGLKTILNPTSMARIFKNKNYLKENNNVFKLRIYENGFVRGSTLSAGALQFTHEISRKAINASLKGMELMDRFTCYATFTLAEEYIKKTYGYAIGSQENLKLANEMWTDMILETQSNSDRISMSRIRSGEKGLLVKNLFGLFQSDAQNKAGLLANIINDLYVSKKEIKNLEKAIEIAKTESEKNSIQKQIDSLKREKTRMHTRIYAYASGLILSGLVAALADMLADWVYDKDEPEDTSVVNILTETLFNSTIDWIPYFNQINNWIKYDGVEISMFEDLNEMIQVIKNFTDGEITVQDYAQAIIKFGTLLGMPLDNLNKLIQGTLGNFNPKLALQYRNLFYAMSQTYLGKQTNEYIKSGHYDKAQASISLNYSLYKFSISDYVAEEIIDFKKNGIDLSIKNIPSNITDSNGETLSLSEKEIKDFKEIYSSVSKKLDELINSSIYQKLSMEEKSKAIKKLTDIYHDMAKYKVLGITPSSRISLIACGANSNVNLVEIILTIADLNSKLVGSTNKKETLMRELNKLSNKTKNEKLLITYLMGYSITQNNIESFSKYLEKLGYSKNEFGL